jgi:hypothetical protein
MIKILTRHSAYGGSTIALIRLCNLFNSSGLECTLYGPNTWHLNKCNGGLLNIARIGRSDTVIYHCLDAKKRPDVRKFVLTCHEKHDYPLQAKPYQVFDNIHFVSEAQFMWHHILPKRFFICPNLQPDLKPSPAKPDRVAGIIGTVMRIKRVDISIQRALDNNMQSILIYGNKGDDDHFEKDVKPFLDRYSQVRYMGWQENVQAMYDSISDVYHSSESETYCLVVDECIATETVFHGNDNIPICRARKTDSEILQIWRRELDL